MKTNFGNKYVIDIPDKLLENKPHLKALMEEINNDAETSRDLFLSLQEMDALKKVKI